MSAKQGTSPRVAAIRAQRNWLTTFSGTGSLEGRASQHGVYVHVLPSV